MGGVITPEYLVIHFTAGRNAQSAIDHFRDPSARVSAHVVIGRQGEICQVVPFNRKAWHAGPGSTFRPGAMSSWPRMYLKPYDRMSNLARSSPVDICFSVNACQ